MQNKRLFRSLALLLVFSFVISLFAGCDTSKENASDVSVTVITTLFPLFDFARVITDGTDAEVSLLLPPGVEDAGVGDSRGRDGSARDPVFFDQTDRSSRPRGLDRRADAGGSGPGDQDIETLF